MTPTRDPDALWYSTADDARRALLRRLLPRHGGRPTQALAAQLGISRSSLYREALRLGAIPAGGDDSRQLTIPTGDMNRRSAKTSNSQR
jgi:glyoxylase-like metal-dependent hydrolase (beta-lactamase superfamily II)